MIPFRRPKSSDSCTLFQTKPLENLGVQGSFFHVGGDSVR